MTDRRIVQISKFLSLHLRHTPDALGLTLEPGGWVEVDALLDASARQGMAFSRNELEEVVRTSDKQRFAIDPTGRRIRANQGHSVPVDLELRPIEPPSALYHGTGVRAVEDIMREGLKRMERHHVHLSAGIETARRVGARHGKPVVFEVDAAAMYAGGHAFFQTENGVWLVEWVPPAFLTQLD